MYWGGGLLLTLLVISGVISCLRNFSYTLNSVDDSSSGVTFAIYLNDGYDNYVEYEGDVFPAKADGYKYNADISNCTDLDGNNSSNYSLYYNNDMVQVSTQESVYCYIYFDMYSYDGDYCLVNGITEYLGECALVMDDYSYTVEAAKQLIESKDAVDTSKIAPNITYGQSVSYSQTTSVSTTGYFTIGQSYSFNTETGYYTLKTTSNPSILSDDYIGYYTCGESVTTSCPIIYKIISYTITEDGTTILQKINEADIYTYSVSQTIDSANGMYASEDDTDTSYYYRGSVENNYVLFAGYYWRIIRINGDGSVRLIYQGQTADSTGTDAQVGTSQFNKTSSDLTYVGYKYGTISSIPVIQENTNDFTGFSANTTYYFGTSYEETGLGTFKLSGTIVSGTFSALFGSEGTYADDIKNYYTCFKTSATGTCELLEKLYAYNGSASAKVHYISYASTSYEDTLTNENDSIIKNAVDTWYEDNILDKYDDDQTHLLSEYISTSAIFCGDRSLYSTFTGAGYILSTRTYYSAYNRLMNKFEPSFKCSNIEDRYSVDNGNLDYPIALITADEVMFAGGKVYESNVLFYLYTGVTYWTMTPSDFNPPWRNAYVYYLNSTGSLYASSSGVAASYGVRPVINLSSSVKISSGTGTSSNPFRVTLD